MEVSGAGSGAVQRPVHCVSRGTGSISAVVADPYRIAAVRRLVPLYRPPSLRFDRLTHLAAQRRFPVLG